MNDINKKRHVVPPGWETKDEVAISLQCDADKVSDLLKPGLASGDIEKQDFSVWDEKRRLAVRVTCYRLADRSGKKTPELVDEDSPTYKASKGPSLIERIELAIKNYPHKPNHEIAKSVYKARVADVQMVRDRM